MCGRYVITTPVEALAALFGFAERPNLAPRYNLAPTQTAPVIVADASGAVQCRSLRWGLVPRWAKDDKGAAKLINARGETVAEKPSFRSAFRARRCLVPADGFYEWDRSGPQKQPWLIGLANHAPFAMAGLWERWRPADAPADVEDGPAAESVETFCIITTAANRLVGRIHDRMPVILQPADWRVWLDGNTPAAVLSELLCPLADDLMSMHPVATRVGSVRNDDPDLIRPLPTAPAQARLM